jgi:hypothetical protein
LLSLLEFAGLFELLADPQLIIYFWVQQFFQSTTAHTHQAQVNKYE